MFPRTGKAYLYGRTRSWSLIGSGVSAVLSIFIMLAVASMGHTENIFLFSVLPYVQVNEQSSFVFE